MPPTEEVKPRLIKVLEKLNLPTTVDYDTDIIIEAMRHDKKMSGDEITVVYVPSVGTFQMKTMPFSELAKEFKGMKQ